MPQKPKGFCGAPKISQDFRGGVTKKKDGKLQMFFLQQANLQQEPREKVCMPKLRQQGFLQAKGRCKKG
ncbi:hypothetical protein J4433_01570 [Candidatus Pacearchaeota archaeon]|nr:hypothetical protein [Candidatus Pacearchaeota archaeon]